MLKIEFSETKFNFHWKWVLFFVFSFREIFHREF